MGERRSISARRDEAARSQAEADDPFIDLDAAIETAIAACDGDPRATIRALIIANQFLDEEADRLRAVMSAANARDTFHRWLEQAQRPAAGGPGDR